MPTAKALAGALTAIIVYVVTLVGLDLPEGVVGALLTVITGAVVYLVPNKEQTEAEPEQAFAHRYALSPLALFLFAAKDVSEGEALFWIGVLVVVGCLVAAAVAAFRYAQYVGAAVLVVIAIVAAVLLL